MKKIFIYGAGSYGELVHKEINNKYNILGFVDSDEKKQGKFIKKKKIFNPGYLNKCKYDYILIASMWSLEIKKSLLKKKVSSKKIKIYPISRAHKNIKKNKNWKKIFKNVINIFKKNKINYYLDHSSLLGYIRSKNIYKYGDIDLAINCEDLNKILLSLKSSKKFKKIEIAKLDINDKLFGINFSYQITIDDLIDLQVKKLIKKFRYWIVGSSILKIKDDFTGSLVDINFKKIKIKIPKNYKLYLKILYGNEWFIPAKNWTYDEYANIVKKIKFINFQKENY